jgi:hypothetical protein
MKISVLAIIFTFKLGKTLVYITILQVEIRAILTNLISIH